MVDQACRCIRELGVPFFRHEVVKRALILAMEIQTAGPLILKLLKEASEEGFISSSQMVKGFSRLGESLEDLTLDIPSAKTLFQSLVPRAISEGWLDSLFLRSGEDAAGAQGIAGAGQIIRRNAENVAARWEMQAARLEAHVEQMFDGLDDADGAEDVPFDELVGMQGPVFHLVENASTVLASNMIFLGVVIFVPFSLGRVILHHVSWILSSATSPVLSTVMPLTESALSLANITWKNALTAVVNVTSNGQNNNLLDQVTEMLNANATGSHEAHNLSSPFLWLSLSSFFL